MFSVNEGSNLFQDFVCMSIFYCTLILFLFIFPCTLIFLCSLFFAGGWANLQQWSFAYTVLYLWMEPNDFLIDCHICPGSMSSILHTIILCKMYYKKTLPTCTLLDMWQCGTYAWTLCGKVTLDISLAEYTVCQLVVQVSTADISTPKHCAYLVNIYIVLCEYWTNERH